VSFLRGSVWCIGQTQLTSWLEVNWSSRCCAGQLGRVLDNSDPVRSRVCQANRDLVRRLSAFKRRPLLRLSLPLSRWISSPCIFIARILNDLLRPLAVYCLKFLARGRLIGSSGGALSTVCDNRGSPGGDDTGCTWSLELLESEGGGSFCPVTLTIQVTSRFVPRQSVRHGALFASK
jgi:hypothetical protein